MLTDVCCKIVAADEAVPYDIEERGVLYPEHGGVNWPGASTP